MSERHAVQTELPRACDVLFQRSASTCTAPCGHDRKHMSVVCSADAGKDVHRQTSLSYETPPTFPYALVLCQWVRALFKQELSNHSVSVRSR